MKTLGQKAIFNRLQKELDKRFTEGEQTEIEFYEDIESDNSYIWDCKYKGKRFKIGCNKKSGVVKYREV
ncbi:hypothetical protein NXG04_07960 [Klebsiella pneumoniae]|nr:hypothetical protein [Klebsiella pneumoniae]MDS7714490.1 hypothetical protein [Klebsiella pneumoniae]UUV46385.1 hypothetical protein [Bacillus phage vB_BanS-Thrax2]